MRHDPAAGAIVIMLRSLKMYGMAQAVEDLIEQGAVRFNAMIRIKLCFIWHIFLLVFSNFEESQQHSFHGSSYKGIR